MITDINYKIFYNARILIILCLKFYEQIRVRLQYYAILLFFASMRMAFLMALIIVFSNIHRSYTFIGTQTYKDYFQEFCIKVGEIWSIGYRVIEESNSENVGVLWPNFYKHWHVQALLTCPNAPLDQILMLFITKISPVCTPHLLANVHTNTVNGAMNK